MAGMRLSVVGAGYVGLATAVGFARHGNDVTLVEIDQARLSQLRAGELPFHEPSISEPYREVLGRTLEVVDSIALSADATMSFICVGTPSSTDGTLQVSSVFGAAREVADVSGGGTTIVIRSTVSPGTSAALEFELRQRYATAVVVANPEFLREGTALLDFEQATRRVVGGSDARAVEDVCERYAFSRASIVRTDATTAELIKLGANAALAVRLSMANELADLAVAFDIDPQAVLQGIGADPRIGADYLRPGIGFGGSCLPKDLNALRAAGHTKRTRTNVFDAAAATNEQAIERLTARTLELLDGAPGPVCVVGLGFKPGSDSIRDSRALPLIRALLDHGVRVCVYDPLAVPSTRAIFGDAVDYLDEPSLKNVRGLVIATHGNSMLPREVPASVPVIDGLGRSVAR
jgi:UDPglucose 6-dehydrogenase